MTAQQMLYFKERLQIADAQGFRLLRAGDHETVIVGKHDNGFAPEVRSEYLLATGVKAIAVNQGEHESGSNG
jgi:hypothetical protein